MTLFRPIVMGQDAWSRRVLVRRSEAGEPAVCARPVVRHVWADRRWQSGTSGALLATMQVSTTLQLKNLGFKHWLEMI